MAEKEKLVVVAGYATVKTQVGAGMAYVDVAQGQPVPDDISDEERDRLIRDGVAVPDGQATDDRVVEHTAPDGSPVARPVPGEVEPDEIDPDVIPAGSTEQVMEWVGDDLARARVARHEERAKGDKARAGLLERLEQKIAGLESEPPAVSEALSPQAAAAPAGGVAVPHDTATEADRPAQEAATDMPARGGRTRRASGGR